MGNPLDYYNGFNFHWEGRELRTALSSDGLIVFMYNEDGLRFLKNHDGFQTDYYYDGTRLVGEQNQNETILYVYDDTGIVIGMQYRLTTYAEDVWDVYWFERNLQGDIVAVYNTTGTKLISYTYDAWGNFTTVYSNGGENTTAIKNPFRYRGYYYDYDLQLYYLQTRYYDSVTGRFISADNTSVLTATPTALTDKNLYAYCDNNPVMRVDYGGQFWGIVFDVVSLGFSVADVIANPSDAWAWVGLVGDIVDLLPFVSGLGEATDLVRAATKIDDVVDAIDDVHDTAKAIDNTIDSYKALKKANKGTGLEIHHIVEKRFAPDLDIKNTDEMLSIALTKSEHRIYTNAWRTEIGYATGPHSPQQIWEAAQSIYINRPDLLEAAWRTIFGG